MDTVNGALHEGVTAGGEASCPKTGMWLKSVHSLLPRCSNASA
jgi:hypothetical protein